MPNSKAICELKGHTDRVRTGALSMDGHYVLTGSWDKTARLWDAETCQELRRFEGHTSFVNAVAISGDGSYVLTGSSDTTARLWDQITGLEIHRFVGHTGSIISVAFSADSRYVVTGGDMTARLWDRETGQELRRFEGHNNFINSVAISADGRYVLTGSWDKTARLWDSMTGQEVRRYEENENGIISAVFSSDGHRILTMGTDNITRILDRTTGQELRRFKGPSRVHAIAISINGDYVLTGSEDTTRIWNAATGKELASLISFRDGTWAVVDPEGRYDASNAGDVEGLHWVVGNTPIALSQLKERYYDPGLLAKISGFKKEALRDVQAFTQVALHPHIELRPPHGQQTKLGIKLTNQGGGIGRVVVLINGNEIATDARSGKTAPTAKTADLSIDIKGHPNLMPGRKNRIEVIAYNAEGYISSRGVAVDYDAPGIPDAERPTLWAIVAGISKYTGDALDLRFAAKDARDMAQAIKLGGSRLFGAGKVKLYTFTSLAPDQPPTRDNLKNAFAALEGAKPGDIVVIYLAGHGVAYKDEYYYLTREASSSELADPDIRKYAAISSANIVDWIKKSPSNYRMIILDTCAAGAFEQKLSVSRDISSDQIRALDRMKDRTGFHVLMGSAADRVSYEASQYEQGLLTYALLKGMKGPALREQEFVDVGTLFSHAEKEVPTLARNIGGIQSPRIAAPRGSSFDIGQLKEEDRLAIHLAQSKPFLLPPVLQNADELYDNLELSQKIRKRLRDISYSTFRGSSTNTPAVFVDADQLAGAIYSSGSYQVKGNMVTVSLVLVKDGKKISALQPIEGPANKQEKLVEMIIESIFKGIYTVKGGSDG